MNTEQIVYVLMTDFHGGRFSHAEPFGIAVDTEEEAKRFVRESSLGYDRSYVVIKVFSKYEGGNTNL